MILGLLLFSALSAALLAAYARRSAPDCHWSESANSCYRRGLEAAVTAVRTPRGTPDRQRLEARAVKLMGESCRRDHAMACSGLARQLLIGDPDSLPVRRKAAEMYEKGCLARIPSPAACNGLGEAYAYAVGRVRDSVRALESFERACELGHATACFRAAGRLRTKSELGRWGADSARTLAALACSRGSMTGCLERASRTDVALRDTAPERYGRERYEADRAFVISTYTRACDAYFFIGCHNLGRIYQDFVLEIPHDTARARSYYARACDVRGAPERGRSLACKALGDLELAQGAPTARVDTLYRAGCRMFAPEACVELARLREGDQAWADSALLHAVTACVQRYAPGCTLAAALYQRPWLRNPAEALRYRRRACDFGAVAECVSLGNDWAFVDSTALAHKYHRRACALPGGAAGCEWLATQAEIRNAGGACQRAGAGLHCPRRADRRSRIVGMGSVPGTLAPGDGVLNDGSYYDEWVVRAERQRPLRVTLRAPGFDAFLSVGGLVGSTFTEFWSNDDKAEGTTNARVTLVPPRNGDLVIRVNTFGPAQHGAYVLTVIPAP